MPWQDIVRRVAVAALLAGLREAGRIGALLAALLLALGLPLGDAARPAGLPRCEWSSSSQQPLAAP